MLQGRGLIVEQDRNFTGALQDESHGVLELSLANSMKQALQILQADAAHISVVFVSTSVQPKNGLEVVREIRALRPSLPIILFDHHDVPKITKKDVDSLGCLALVQKPKVLKDILAPLVERLELQNSWKDVAPTKEDKNVTIDVADADYLPVPITDFVFTAKSLFNIHIRLSKGKFVKVLNAGDQVEAAFIAKYLEKGIKTLYVREDEHQRYINFCDKLLKETLAKHEVPLSEQANKVLHLGESVKQSLYQSGITQERMHFAGNFLQHSAELARNMRYEDQKLFDMMEGLLNRDHVTTVVMLAGMLSQYLGFESRKAVQMVGMAALFHDIGLYDLLPNIKREDPDSLSKEERALWDKHPERGEEILRAMGGLDEIVYQSVAQHHMRKRGELSRKTARQITLVSEIIGAADDFQNVVLTGEFDPRKLEIFLNEKLPLFSPAIAEAFEKVLKEKK